MTPFPNPSLFIKLSVFFITLATCVISHSAGLDVRMFPWEQELIFTNKDTKKERKLILSTDKIRTASSTEASSSKQGEMHWVLSGENIPQGKPIKSGNQEISYLYPDPALHSKSKQFTNPEGIWQIGPVMIIACALFTKELSENSGLPDISQVSGANAQILIDEDDAFIWSFPGAQSELKVTIGKMPARTVTFTLRHTIKASDPSADWSQKAVKIAQQKHITYTLTYPFRKGSRPIFLTSDMVVPGFVQ